MFGRRAPRFAVEVLVLVVLAVSLTIAQLHLLVIAGAMLLGWLIVSVVEWVSLRGEAHYGSGLPPRYYVPQVRLPPPLKLEERQRRGPPPLTPEEHVRRYAPSAPPVEKPTSGVSLGFEQQAAVVGGWSVTAPEQEAAPLEPAAFIAGTEQTWQPEQPAADDVAAPIEPESAAAPPGELEPATEPSIASESELEPEPAAEDEPAEPELEEEAVAEAPKPQPAISAGWFDARLPGEAAPVEPAFEPELEEEPELELPEPVAWEPVAEVEELLPELEIAPAPEDALVLEPLSELPVSVSWFDAYLPGASGPDELDFGLELAEEPVLELSEPLVEEPVAELELPQPEPEPELEEEPVLELLPELPPVPAGWFDAQLPGAPAPGELEPDVELEPALELPEPVVEEPAAELELPDRELELEPELDLELLAGEPLPEELELASWFDEQLPGAFAWPEADSADEAELPAWAVVDPERGSEWEDELAADESLAEELEPLFALASETESDPELDFEVPLGAPLPEEPHLASWFDTSLPGIWVSEQGATEAEWLSEPDPPQQKTSAQIAAEAFRAEEPPPVPVVFVPEPVAPLELPESELELDILVERLAGEPLGNDASLVGWFDAQLPGALVSSKAKSDEDETALVIEDVWERTVAAEEDPALAEVAVEAPDVTARHSIDPLVGVVASKSRLWGRQHAEDQADEAVTVEIPAYTIGRRLLPGRSKRKN
jgi:hypothetical protein